MAVLVDVSALEIAWRAATPRAAHVVARGAQIVREDELLRVAADDLFRPVSQDRPRTWADAQEDAMPVDDQDQVERRIEDALVDRARRLPLPFILGARCNRAIRRGRAKQDDVTVRMRVAPDIDPCGENFRITREDDRLAVMLGRNVGKTKLVILGDTER